jgi:hypothetical protein
MHAAEIEASKDELDRSQDEHCTAMVALGSALEMQRDQEQAMQSSVVETINPQLSTLNKPETLNSQTSTLNLKIKTLNSKTSTQNP